MGGGWALLLSILLLGSTSGAVPAPAGDLLLTANHVGKLMIGMPESAIYTIYPRRMTKKVDLRLEGSYSPAVQVFLTEDRRHPSLVIRLDGNESRIYGIEVLDPRFQTEKHIHVGSTLGQLRNAESNLMFVTGEGTTGASAENLAMTFSLRIDSATATRLSDPTTSQDPGSALSKIPAGTVITSIWVHRLFKGERVH
jgi:hypothetical protein